MTIPVVRCLSGSLIALAGALLAACGGGGGTSAPPPLLPIDLAPAFESRHAPVGPLRILVLSLDYPGDGEPAIPFAEVQQMVTSFNARLQVQSHGVSSVVADIAEVQMPNPSSSYVHPDLPIRMRRDALGVSLFAGVELPDTWDRLVLIGKQIWPTPVAGFAIGHCMYLSEPNDVLLMHEFLHTYEKYHANSFDPSAPVPNQASLEYGNGADYLGSVPPIGANPVKGLHAKTQVELGWLPESRILRVDASSLPVEQTFSLWPLESGLGLSAIVLPTASGDHSYWIEYRSLQPLLKGPVVARAANRSTEEIRLLDPTPNGASIWTEAYVVNGSPFVTPEGIRISAFGVQRGELATVSVSIPTSATTVADRAPVVGLATLAPDSDVVSGIVTFEVSAYDPDAPESIGREPQHFDGIREIRLELFQRSDDENSIPVFSQVVRDELGRFTVDTTQFADTHYKVRVTAVPSPGLGVSSVIETRVFFVNG